MDNAVEVSEFKTSEAINELAAALAKAQGSMTPAIKSAKNPFFKSSYADLGAVMEVIRKPLADNGLSVIQGPFTMDGRIAVRTRLMHSSGQWIESVMSAEPKDMGPQAAGSVITYLRRYALSAMAGVSTEDDDGNAAEGHSAPQPVRDATPAKPPAQNWKKPVPAPAMKPNPPFVCEHGVSAPNKCLECAAFENSAK